METKGEMSLKSITLMLLLCQSASSHIIFRRREDLALVERMIQIDIHVDLASFDRECMSLQKMVKDLFFSNSFMMDHGRFARINMLLKTVELELETQCQVLKSWAPDQSRKERSILSAALGLLFPMLSISELFHPDHTDSQIHHLHIQDHAIKELAESQKALAEQIQVLHSHFIQAVDRLQKELHLQQVAYFCQQRGRQLEAIGQALGSLAHQNLDIRLLPTRTVHDIYKNVSRLAQKHHLFMPYTKPQEVTQFPAVFSNPDQHSLTVHVLIPLSKAIYTLHEHVPTPLTIKNNGTDLQMAPKPQYEVIGISHAFIDDRRIFLNDKDLLPCMLLGSTYFCSHFLYRPHSPATACLEALYDGDHEGIMNCPLVLDERDWVVHATSVNDLLIFSRNDLPYNINCQNSTSRSAIFNPGPNKIVLDASCYLRTTQFAIKGMTFSYIKYTVRASKFNMTKMIGDEEMLKKFGKQFNETKLSVISNSASEIVKRINSADSKLDENYFLDYFKDHGHAFSNSLTIVICVIAIILFHIYLYKLVKNNTK